MGKKIKNLYQNTTSWSKVGEHTTFFFCSKLGSWRPHGPYLSVLLQTIYETTQEAVSLEWGSERKKAHQLLQDKGQAALPSSLSLSGSNMTSSNRKLSEVSYTYHLCIHFCQVTIVLLKNNFWFATGPYYRLNSWSWDTMILQPELFLLNWMLC